MKNEFKWINNLISKAGTLAKGVGNDAFAYFSLSFTTEVALLVLFKHNESVSVAV